MNDKVVKILSEYKNKSYSDLKEEIDQNKTYEVEHNGNHYTLEVNIFWDDEAKGVIRVAVFTNFIKRKWWQSDKPVYSALISSDGHKDESSIEIE